MHFCGEEARIIANCLAMLTGGGVTLFFVPFLQRHCKWFREGRFPWEKEK